MASGSPNLAASLGMVAGTVALVGAAVPVRDGETDPAVTLALAGAVLVVGVFFARRHGLLDRRVGAPLAILASAVTAVAALAAVPVSAATFTLPLFGAAPTHVFAVLGGGAAAAVGLGDALEISPTGMYERAGATLVYSSLGLLGFLAIQLWALVLVVGLLFTMPDLTSPEQFSTAGEVVLSQSATVLGFGTVAAVYLWGTGHGRAYIDLAIPSLRDVAVILGGIVGIFGVAMAVGVVIDLLGTETATHGTIERGQDNPELLLLMVPASILIIGPFEELLYRNVIQKSLYSYFSRPGAVVAASVPFALVHFPAYSTGTFEQAIGSLLVVLTLSLALGTFYALTDNLVVPALVHGCYNAVIFLNMYLAVA